MRHEKIEDEALDWLARREGEAWTDSSEAELEAWLGESMAHKAAFWRAKHGWQKADRVRSLGSFNDEVASLRRATPRWWKPAAIAASILIALAIIGLGTAQKFVPGRNSEISQTQFATAVGAQKSIDLSDGTRVELNTNTKLRTAVTDAHREVWIESGEAFFEVAHRPDEPFIVHAGRQTITVLGTKFAVRFDEDRVIVNVLEGRVKVQENGGSDTHAAIISTGDTSISRRNSTLIAGKSEIRVANALAWRSGMLRFEHAPLSDVVSEFNRYNRVQLVVTDEATSRLPIGGSFQASSANSFVRLLEDAYGLKIEQDENVVKISSD